MKWHDNTPAPRRIPLFYAWFRKPHPKQNHPDLFFWTRSDHGLLCCLTDWWSEHEEDDPMVMCGIVLSEAQREVFRDRMDARKQKLLRSPAVKDADLAVGNGTKLSLHYQHGYGWSEAQSLIRGVLPAPLVGGYVFWPFYGGDDPCLPKAMNDADALALEVARLLKEEKESPRV